MATKKKTAAVDEAAAEAAVPKVVNVVVLKQFRDKETKELHRVGDKLTMSEARMQEILTKGELVKLV